VKLSRQVGVNLLVVLKTFLTKVIVLNIDLEFFLKILKMEDISDDDQQTTVCNHHGCQDKPAYSCDNKTFFCRKNKTPYMKNVVGSLCENPDCTRQARYNYKGEILRRFCYKHKLFDMINVRDRLCECCDVMPSFNYPGEKVKRFCDEHKLEGMVYLKSRVKCLANKCETQASFYYPTEKKAIFCSKHKLENMVYLRKN
jgi:hypothetical protein